MDHKLNNKKILLVTGPNGFIGKQFLKEIFEIRSEYVIKVISRNTVNEADVYLNYDSFMTGQFNASFFDDVDQVVHLASVAHKFRDIDPEVLNVVNNEYLKKLLSVLNPKKLETFLFLSSYAVSLLEKNIVLDTHRYAELKEKNEKHIVGAGKAKFQETAFYVLRTPLVYGKGAPGNFDRLIKILLKPLPLPFGKFHFKRSFIHVRNLTSFMFLLLRLSKPEVGVNLLEIGDPWDETFLSFIARLKNSIEAPSLIVPVPLFLIKIVLNMIGKRNYFKKLTLEFSIDYGSLLQKYDWDFPVKKENSFVELL